MGIWDSQSLCSWPPSTERHSDHGASTWWTSPNLMWKVKYKWSECLQIASFPERAKDAAWYCAVTMILPQWSIEWLSQWGHGVIQWEYTHLFLCVLKGKLNCHRSERHLSSCMKCLCSNDSWCCWRASGEPSYCFYLNKLLRRLFFASLHKMFFTWQDMIIFNVPYVC